jgi:hypothetical protein
MKTVYNKINLILLCLFVVLLITESGCTRKGEDDPLVSLRTRKNRVVGKWKVTSGKMSTDSHHTLLIPVSWSHNGSSESATSSTNSSFSSVQEYTTEVEFKSDASFEWVMIHTDTNGIVQRATYSGIWDFSKRNDAVKDKSELILRPEKAEGVWPNNSYFVFPSRQSVPVFTIRELRHDKIVIHREYEIPLISGNPFSGVSLYYEEWTLEPR